MGYGYVWMTKSLLNALVRRTGEVGGGGGGYLSGQKLVASKQK